MNKEQLLKLSEKVSNLKIDWRKENNNLLENLNISIDELSKLKFNENKSLENKDNRKMNLVD